MDSRRRNRRVSTASAFESSPPHHRAGIPSFIFLWSRRGAASRDADHSVGIRIFSAAQFKILNSKTVLPGDDIPILGEIIERLW